MAHILLPGTYTSALGTFDITTGDLTLDAQGDANATWVFQSAAALTVGLPATPRHVLLINGAQCPQRVSGKSAAPRASRPAA